jgi:signal transduction histidine kinase
MINRLSQCLSGRQQRGRGERAEDGGTGLGLAIARWVVQLHKGTIAVVDPDRELRGCHIHVSLPLTA